MVNSYQRLLHIKYHNHICALLIFVLLGILSFYIAKKDMYEKLDVYAVSDGENLLLNIPVKYSDTLNEDSLISIKNNRYSYKLNSISELLYDETTKTNYQTFSIHIDKTFPLNEIVNVRIYYNKEKIYFKVLNLIKE